MALFTARRLRVAAAAGVLGSLLIGVLPAAAAAAAPTLTSSNVSLRVDGSTVTATTTVTASSNTVLSRLGVCIYDATRANFDFVKAQNATVTPAGYTYVPPARTLPAGNYTYWTCVNYNNTWINLDSAKPFAVTGSDSTKPVDVAMPVGDLNGWKQVFTDDFTTNAAAGTFGDVYKNKFATYHGFADSYNGGTYNRNIMSVKDGLLDLYLHTENGRPQVAAPGPITTPGQQWAGQTYGKFSVRFKSDALAGYKTAWLLWPDSNVWNQGEIDFPEGGLNGKMMGFNHCINKPTQNCNWVDTQTTYTDWHTMSIEWTPSRVSFVLDGQMISNDTKNVPSNPMHWVLQTETTSQNAVTQDGHLQIDWMSVYTWSPGTTAAPTSGSTPTVTSTGGGATIQTASAWARVG